MFVTFVLFMRTFVEHWKAFRLTRSARQIDHESSVALFDGLRSAIGIQTPVLFLESAKTIAPLTLGLLRPAVILPPGWDAWSDQQQKQVIIHELSHIKRADVVFQTIGRSITALFWFNPIAWYALNRLRFERELAADNCVLEAGEKPSTYAKTLVDLIQFYQRSSMAAGASVTGSGEFKCRLTAILDPTCHRKPVGRIGSRIVFIAFAFFSIAVSTFSLVASGALAENATDKVLVEMSGTVTDESGNPLEHVGVFILENNAANLKAPGNAKEIARTNDRGQFAEKIQLQTTHAWQIVFFKPGWSIEFEKIIGDSKQRFTMELANDQPIELSMQLKSGKRLDRESVNIQLLSRRRAASELELGKFRNSGSLVGLEGDIVESVERIPGVVDLDKTGKLLLHGLGSRKLLQLRTKPEEDSAVSFVLFSGEKNASVDLAEDNSIFRLAAISFRQEPRKASLNPVLTGFINEKLVEYPDRTEFSFAFIKDGKVTYYGALNDHGKAKPTQNSTSAFEIGSITKVFTSDLLAQLVLTDKVNLNQKVQSLSKSGLADHGTTLRQLASHSSGLPQMPQSFFDSGYDETNPYAKFSTSRLLGAYSSRSLIDTERIGKFQYSNFGVSVLGHAISKNEGKEYEALFQERIGKPIGMISTTTDRSKILGRIVKGLNNQGQECSYWDCNAIAPAGGLYSNAQDLAKYAVHCLSGKNEAYKLQCEPVVNRSKSVDQGLGWMLLKSKSGKSFSFHAGGTGGFSAFMAIEPQSRDGLIMLTNVEGGNESTDQFAFDLMARIHRMNVLGQ